MRAKEKKVTENFQIPGEPLSDKELVKLIRKAEKGPFITLEENNKIMDKWIQKNF